MRATFTCSVAALGVATGVACGAEQLAYGEPYGCNGDRFIVYYCRGDSDAGNYVTHPLDNYCKVTYIDRPRRNGFLPETAELRGNILKKIIACGGGAAPVTAAAAAPAAAKTPAAAQPRAAGANIAVPGTGSSKVSLLRLSHTTKGTRVVHYVDELSRKPASSDLVAIWALWVYPDGEPDSPGTLAQWIEFHMHCANRSFGAITAANLDAEARLLEAKALSGKQRPFPKGSVGEDIFDIACKPAAPINGSRFASTNAAIQDAINPAPAAATPAAAARPEPAAAPTNPKDAAARANTLIDAWTAAYNRGDYDGALASLHEYIQLYPKDATGHLFAGHTYRAKGDQAGAERAFLEAQRVAPQDAATHLEVGKHFLEVREDEARARTELLKVLALKDAGADALIPAGELLALADDRASATEAFRRGVQLPGQPQMLARGWVGFARAQYAATRYPQAIAAANEALRLDPANQDVHWTLASIHEDQGNLAGALSERQVITRQQPGDAWAHLNLGDAHAALKQVAPAVAAYDRALELGPKDPLARDFLSILADSYRKVGRRDRAITALRTAINLPHDGTSEGIEAKAMNDFTACRDLGRLLIDEKRYPDVIRMHLARGACHDGMGPGAVGAAYLALDQVGKAVAHLEEAVEGLEESLDWGSSLSSGKRTAREQAFDREYRAEKKAEAAQDLYALGRAYLAVGRGADAQRIAVRLQRLDPKLAAQLSAGPGAAR
ncbi:MAG: tetratricopeptide repeat protein [Steroidobacteraceae bacterium]